MSVNSSSGSHGGGCGHTCVKVGIGKLLSLSQGRLNDLEFVGVGEEVADRLVRQRSIVMRLVDGGSSPVLCDLDV